MKFKRGQKLMTLNEVENLPEYAGVLDSNTILIDIDAYTNETLGYIRRCQC